MAPGPIAPCRGPSARAPATRLTLTLTLTLILTLTLTQACCRRLRRTPSSSRRRGGVCTTTRGRGAPSTSAPTCSRAAASTSSMPPAQPRARRAVLLVPHSSATPALDARLAAWVAPHIPGGAAPPPRPQWPHLGPVPTSLMPRQLMSRRRRARGSLLPAQEHRPRADRPASAAPPLARLRAAARRAAQ